jgi:hypothetical protein
VCVLVCVCVCVCSISSLLIHWLDVLRLKSRLIQQLNSEHPHLHTSEM